MQIIQSCFLFLCFFSSFLCFSVEVLELPASQPHYVLGRGKPDPAQVLNEFRRIEARKLLRARSKEHFFEESIFIVPPNDSFDKEGFCLGQAVFEAMRDHLILVDMKNRDLFEKALPQDPFLEMLNSEDEAMKNHLANWLVCQLSDQNVFGPLGDIGLRLGAFSEEFIEKLQEFSKITEDKNALRGIAAFLCAVAYGDYENGSEQKQREAICRYINLMKSPILPIRSAVAGRLASLVCKHEDNARFAAEAGVLDAIVLNGVEMCIEDSFGGKDGFHLLLRNLGSDPTIQRMATEKIEEIVLILPTLKQEAQEHSLIALSQLCLSFENKVAAVEAGVMEMLHGLLLEKKEPEEGETPLQFIRGIRATSLAVSNISCDCPKAKLAGGELGLVELLVQSLGKAKQEIIDRPKEKKSGPVDLDEEEQEGYFSQLYALENLLHNAPGNIQRAKEADIDSFLLRVKGSAWEEFQKLAADVEKLLH